MKRTWLLICCLIAVTARAESWRPCVGVTASLGSAIQVEGVNYIAQQHLWAKRQLLSGMKFDAGVRHGRHEFYATYQQLNSSVVTDQDHFWVAPDNDYIVSGDEWSYESVKEQRTLLGYRYWPLRGQPRFAPVLGVAAGIVESTTRQRYAGQAAEYVRSGNEFPLARVLYDYDYGYSLHSRTCGDLMLESGVAWALGRGVDALALAELHLYGVDYPMLYIRLGPDSFNYGSYRLLPTFGFQLRYTFGR